MYVYIVESIILEILFLQSIIICKECFDVPCRLHQCFECVCGCVFLMTISQPFHQYDGETRFVSLIPVFCQQYNRKVNVENAPSICNINAIIPFQTSVYS